MEFVLGLVFGVVGHWAWMKWGHFIKKYFTAI